MPWRILVVVAIAGVLAGTVFGFVRGLGHLATLPFAIVEGGILFGVPAALLGLLLVGVWTASTGLRGRNG